MDCRDSSVVTAFIFWMLRYSGHESFSFKHRIRIFNAVKLKQFQWEREKLKNNLRHFLQWKWSSWLDKLNFQDCRDVVVVRAVDYMFKGYNSILSRILNKNILFDEIEMVLVRMWEVKNHLTHLSLMKVIELLYKLMIFRMVSVSKWVRHWASMVMGLVMGLMLILLQVV